MMMISLEQLQDDAELRILTDRRIERQNIERKVMHKARNIASAAIGKTITVAFGPTSYGAKETRCTIKGKVLTCEPKLRWRGRACEAVFAACWSTAPTPSSVSFE